MRKSELDALLKLNRQRERLVKQGLNAAAAKRKAGFEQQLAAMYQFDNDQAWKDAVRSLQLAVQEANRHVAQRCKELGIRSRFARSISEPGWYLRGENAVRERRAELIRVFDAKNAQAEKQAKVEVDRAVLSIETQLLTTALESGEAKAFLDAMRTSDQLTRTITVAEVEKALSAGGFDDDVE